MRLLVTGAGGMLGKSIVDKIADFGQEIELSVLSREQVDLRDKAATADAIAELRPDTIIHAAARVGGIAAKLAEPTGYLLDNLLIDTSVLSAAIELRTSEVLYLGSAAVYPAAYTHPFVEADLLTGTLEEANEGYALSKIAALKVCEYATKEFGLQFKVALPSNLYGVFDHFELSNAHLVAATLAKVHAAMVSGAESVSVWGDGTARREFTFSGDLAEWLVSQVGNLRAWPSIVNLGCGVDHSVAEYYEVAKEIVGYEGELEFDSSKPSGVPRRLLDSSIARTLGWNPQTSLRDGMAATYASYLTTDFAPGR